MCHITDYLEHSRIAGAIEAVERGEDVDMNHILALQSLDIARIGELCALDFIERDRDADAIFEEVLTQGFE